MLRTILPVLSFAFLLGFFAAATRGDDLEDARAARAKLAAEKITRRANDALDRSRTQTSIEAVLALRAAIREVRASDDLIESKKGPLLGRLQARLDALEAGARSTNVTPSQKIYNIPSKTYKPSVADPSGGVSAFAKGIIGPARTGQQTTGELIREREKNRVAVDMAREKSAGGAIDKEINFPANWRNILAARPTGPQLTKKEADLLKTLNSTMSVNYNDDKFRAVINHLQERTGLAIIIDEMSLKDLNIDYDDPVTLKLDKQTVRTVLKTVLGQKGLTYVIKEATIQAMTPKKAGEQTVVRTYSIADLVTPLQVNPQLAFMYGQQNAMNFQAAQMAQQVISLIQTTYEPNYWQPNGPGSIVYFPASKSLIIRASAEMHYQLAQPGAIGR